MEAVDGRGRGCGDAFAAAAVLDCSICLASAFAFANLIFAAAFDAAERNGYNTTQHNTSANQCYGFGLQ